MNFFIKKILQKFLFQKDVKQLLLMLFLCSLLFSNTVFAAAGVPSLLHHEGRLLDSSGNLLGGAGGTNFCFKFSLYDNPTVGLGAQVWPLGLVPPNKMTVNVKNGILNVDIGDTSVPAEGNTLDFDFNSTDEVYLNIQVANSIAGSCAAVPSGSYETLNPRQRVVSAGYAVNSKTVGGFTPSQSPTGNDIPVLNLGVLNLAGSISAGGLSLNLGSDATGDIFYRNVTGNFTRLGIGAPGQALMVSGGGLPSWTPLPAGGDALTTNPLSQFASTTSLQLSTVISDETGTGSLVFSDSPTLVTPDLGTPSALVGTNITGTASGLTAGSVTNATLTTALTVNTGTVTLVGNVANTSSLTLGAGASSFSGTSSGTNTGDQTNIPGNAATVTFADAGGDTTTFVALGTSATGSLAPATDAGLTYNATTDTLTTTTFVGALTGNASTATALAANPVDCLANTFATTIAANGDLTCASITDADVPNNITIDLAALATALQTPRAIYGNNFDGTAALTQVIASTYGGTGNGFTKFTGPTTTEKTFTLPDASATLLYSGGPLGTPSSGVATNLTGTAAGLSIGGNAATVTNATLTTALTVNTGTVTLVGNVANTSSLTLGAGASSVSGTNTGDQTDISGNAATVTFADAGGDTTTFVALGTSATGSLAPATDAGLTYNATTDTLTTTTFIGALTGNASTASALAANPADCSANTFATTIAANGDLTCASITDADVPNNITIDLAALATALQTPRAIYGNNFDGTAALTQVIASTYGGTGNGFTKFTGPTTTEKTFTLPDASATLLYSGGALGTPSSGVATNLTGTAAGLTAGSVTNATLTTALTVNTGTVTLVGNVANTSSLTLGAGASSFSGTSSGINTGDQTNIPGNAATVTFADAGGDTTTFVALGTSATGSLAPATDAGLTYNATTDTLTTTTFVGALTGNASTATALAANPVDCLANTFATTIAANGDLTCASITDADVPNNITIDLAALATALQTPRAIYGNNFDGTAALTQVIASTYGGTGNGFTKFTGPTTAEKTFTLPDASATLLYSGGPLGTPSSGVATNLTGTATGLSIGGNAATVTNATLTTALTVNTGTVTLVGNVANTSSLTLGAGASSFSGTSSGINTGDQTNIPGNAATVTFADAGGDTTTFVALGTSATGSLAPATDAGLTYNATTDTLTTTTFVGALTGNASTATALAANPVDCLANTFATTIAANGDLTCASITDADVPNNITIDLAALATALQTPRAIYGNNFDGTAALTQVIASTYGGTGNGFTKFTGPTTAEKTFTLPDASATLLYSGGPLGTPSSGVATNLTGTATGLSIGGNAATVTNATLTTALTVNTGTVTLVGNVANTSSLTLGAGASSFSGTSSGINTGDQTNIPGNAATVTFADAGGDTTTFVALGTSATGSLAPATDAGLTYNATTDTLTTTTFVGALTGNASTATALAANPVDCLANTFATTIAANGDLTCASITDADVPNNITIDLAALATALQTPRAIYGNNFDGTAALTQVIASTYGGTGNGFTKFTGPTTTEKTFTLPDASATLLYSGGALGTPSSGVATNLTGTAAGLTAGSVTNATLTTALTVNTGTVTLVGNVANTSSLTLGAGASSFSGTSSGINTGDQTNIPGNAATVTFADAGGDTTTFVALGTSATGSLAPATDAGLTYNATTDTLTTTTFVGALTGNASTATALAANPVDCLANTFATTIAANGDLTCASITDADVPNNITIDLAALATALQTPRAIYGNNFDGTAALTQVIASTYGGTGNGFTKFTGPTTTEKTFTLPDASATLLYSGGALGTPSSGVATNLTGTAAGLTAGSVTNATLTTALTVNTGTVTLVGNVANTSSLTLGAGASSFSGTSSGINTGDQTNIPGNAATVTFADAGGDTTTFVALGTSATGSLAPATDAGLTYNATTDTLTTTTFVGALTGNASTATALAANPVDCLANTFATTIAANGDLTCASITDADVPNNITIDLAALATALQTPRAIYGNNFDGTAALTQVIASTYGGTGNGFTKFTGPTTAEKTFTLPDASATLLYSGGPLGTPSSGVATNLTGTATGLSIGGNAATVTGLSVTGGKVLTVSNSLTLSGTDGSTLNIGTGGTLGANAYTSTAYAPIASPTFTGTVTIPTPFTLGATSVTTTGTQLNFLNAAGGTTGTTSTNLVFSTSPVLVTPSLGAATGTGLALTSANDVQLTTSSALVLNANSLTSGTGFYAASSTLAAGKLVDLQISGTAAAASQTGLNILTAGATTTNAITTYGAQIANTHTNGTSGTNVALLLSASGATTANYGLQVTAGGVYIGANTPSSNGNGTLIASTPNTAGLTIADFQVANTSVFKVTSSNGLTFAGGGSSNGTINNAFTLGIKGAINVTSEVIPVQFNAASYTITGSYANQRITQFTQPTITAGSALSISTEADTVNISGAPISAGSATLAKSVALRISAGTSVASGATAAYGLYVDAPSGGAANYAATFATGNVGIGVTAPTARLHLAAGTTSASSAPLKFTSGSLMTSPEAGAVEFLTDAFYGTITTGAARKQFAFTDSAMTSTMYIGTTAHALNRSSAAEDLAGITGLTPGADFTLTQNSVAPFTSVESGAVANTLYLKTGQVGIGTNAPTSGSMLDVKGSGTGRVLMGGWTGSDAYGAISLNSSAATADYNFISSPGDKNLYINRPTGANIFFSENQSTFQMLLQTGGDLGIGTLTPENKLQVTGGSTAAGSTPISRLTTGTGAHGDEALEFGILDGSYAWIEAIKQGSAFRNLALNPSGGNVGIGTTAPGTKLEVYSGQMRLNRANLDFTQESAPGAATVATGAAGVLTGTYSYKISFQASAGETQAGTASANVSPSSQQVSLSAIPTGTAGVVTQRYIYRTKAGGSRYYFLAAIVDNSTTTYTDNTADGSLGSTIAPSMNTTAGAFTIGNQLTFISDSASANSASGYQAGTGFRDGTGNTAYGFQSAYFSNGVGSTYLGYQAGGGTDPDTSNPYLGIFLGYRAGQTLTTGGTRSVYITANSTGTTTGAQNTIIGIEASGGATDSNSIGLGYNVATTASNQLVIGGNIGGGVVDGYIGNGVTATAPNSFTLNASGGSGSDIAGANFILAGGKATGNAAGGSILFKTSDVGGSGTTLQTLSTKLSIDNAGLITTTKGTFLSGVANGGSAIGFTLNTPAYTTTAKLLSLQNNSVEKFYIDNAGILSTHKVFDKLTIVKTGFTSDSGGLFTDTDPDNGAVRALYLVPPGDVTNIFVGTAANRNYTLDFRNSIAGIANLGKLYILGPTPAATTNPVFRATLIDATGNIAGFGANGTPDLFTFAWDGTNQRLYTSPYGGFSIETGTNQNLILSPNGSGTTVLTNGTLLSGVANGGSAIGFMLNTPSYTTTATLLALKNNGTEKFAVQQDGALYYGLFDTHDPSNGVRLALAMPSNSNTHFGYSASTNQTSAARNSTFGYNAGYAITSGTDNTAMGYQALVQMTDGSGNTAIGTNALFSIAGSAISNNSAFGFNSGYSTVLGYDNVYFGLQAGYWNVDGTRNVYVGRNSGLNNLGSGNIVFGYGSGLASSGTTNYSLAIGYEAFNTTSNQAVIGGNTGNYYNDFYLGGGVTWASATSANVTINATGGEGTNIAGASLTFAGGKGTGNAAGGDLIFKTSDAGGSGTTLQSLTEKMRLTVGGVLHIGTASTTDSATLLTLQDTNSTCNFTADSGAPTCGSDMNLKKDITALDNADILNRLTQLNAVSYHWKTDDANSPVQYGFIAQNVQEQFPNLVKEGTWIDGSQKLFLSMGGLMPYTVGAIKELNLKVNNLSSLDISNPISLGSLITQFLADAGNGIENIFAKQVNTNTLCVSDATGAKTCITKTQLDTLLANSGGSTGGTGGGSDTTAPVITLTGNATMSLNVGDTYTEPGATATDNVDTSVSVVIGGSVDTATAGTYTVTYDAKDTAGNSATQVTRTVTVGTPPPPPASDTTAPVITLTGNATMSLNVGDTYTEPGATATDNVDTSVSVVIGGSVDTATAGTYTVTYDAKDTAGNSATQVTRTVTVI